MPSFWQRYRGTLSSVTGIVAGLTLLLCSSLSASDKTEPSPTDHYRVASLLLHDLRAVPSFELGAEQYLLVINAFRRVYAGKPDCDLCDRSLLTVGNLYQEMADRFGPEPYRAEALKAYRALLIRYPESGLKEEASTAIQQIAGVKPSAGIEAREAPHDEASVRPRPTERTDPLLGTVLTPATYSPSRKRARPVWVEKVRFWSHPDYTRVVVELEDEVQYRYNLVKNPERLYVDLLDSRLSQRLRHAPPIEVADPALKQIRTGQFDQAIARVVFDLEQQPDFSVSWLSNPARLVVELRVVPPAFLAKRHDILAPPREGVTPDRPIAAPPAPGESRTTASNVQLVSPPPARFVNPPRPVVDVVPEMRALVGLNPPAFEMAPSGVAAPLLAALSSFSLPRVERPPAKPKEKTLTAPNEEKRLAKSPPPADLSPPKPAKTTSRGKWSLSRVLGLKVGRVVIDAGHGGHDTGGIGPTGLKEKDLVLDVGLRLGGLVEKRLGSEVVYTRADDSFVPLAERTKLANESKADLFISIHANSSRVRSVRGVETYYLNFTTDPWAMAVASRENAAASSSIHELQDLVSKIALKEKIDESREFAAKVQSSLHKGLSKGSRSLRNRGVRKAPFMVLIGAKMPAILSEIGFLSNAGDEKRLKGSAFRQKVAEHIYDGLAAYAETLSSVRVAQKIGGSPPRD